MELDKIYIEEAIRIRKVFTENIAFVNEIQPYYETLLDEFQKAKAELDEIDMDEIDDNYTEDYFRGKLEELNVCIDNTSNKIQPYVDKINKLDEDQRLLYNRIKEKYPSMTDEEMEQAIIPYIENI